MKKALSVLFLVISSSWLSAQIVLTIQGTEVTDTVTGISPGVYIPRSQPTIFKYLNNSVTSVNAVGYMLQAGDETPGINNNNLDGEIIKGNRFTWNGTDEESLTHGLFTGYNVDVVILYNYLDKTPNGIQRKSDGMTDNSGFIAYNILNNPKVGIVVKGMNSVRIFNNTLFSSRTPAQTGRGLIDIHTNTDGELNAVATGTKIFNNIFYTTNKILNIKIYESVCLERFESDYNVFWCESGEPLFEIEGKIKTFDQWQALGYDLHSVVINPNFINVTDFVPRTRLTYGKDLGPDFQVGLTTDAIWGKTDPGTTSQNGLWQVGARIYEALGEKVSIYPNPAFDLFHVLISDLTLSYRTIKIYDCNGRVIMTDSIEQGLNTFKIPENLSTGIYNISLEGNNIDRHVRKILIIN